MAASCQVTFYNIHRKSNPCSAVETVTMPIGAVLSSLLFMSHDETLLRANSSFMIFTILVFHELHLYATDSVTFIIYLWNCFSEWQLSKWFSSSSILLPPPFTRNYHRSISLRLSLRYLLYSLLTFSHLLSGIPYASFYNPLPHSANLPPSLSQSFYC